MCDSVTFSVSEFEFGVPQNLRLQESVTLVLHWSGSNTRTRRKACKCLVFKRTPFKAVPENVRSRAPPAPEGAPLQSRQEWLGPPSAPLPEVEGTPRSDHIFHSTTQVELRYQQDEFGASRSWSARKCVIIRGMGDYLGRRGERPDG